MKIEIGKFEISATIKARSKSIQNRVENNFIEHETFKKFYATLNTLYRKHNIDDISLIISKDNLLNITPIPTLKSCIELLFSSNEIQGKHWFWVDEKLHIIESRRKNLHNNEQIINFFKKESQRHCVFYLSKEDGIHYFIDGKSVGQSVFFTSTERRKYNKLFPMSKINVLFDSYRIHLEERNIYSKFFVPKSGKKSLAKHLNPQVKEEDYKLFLTKYKQLLNNKPEEYFRDDLYSFLDKNLSAHSVAFEYLLTNLNRLDVSIVDDLGDKYLIEIKWVGTSIHADGHKIGTRINHSKINPNGVIQSVQYIEQLTKQKKNIKVAFLAVFDARTDNSSGDTVASFDEEALEGNLKDYYPQFRKIPDFIVKNIHPR
ncbi:MAG: hypothetical protein ACRBFS_08135 [Aureispira sp.]